MRASPRAVGIRRRQAQRLTDDESRVSHGQLEIDHVGRVLNNRGLHPLVADILVDRVRDRIDSVDADAANAASVVADEANMHAYSQEGDL